MSTINVEADLQQLAAQDKLLQLSAFDQTTAWKLGNRIKELAEADGVALSICVRMGKENVFFYAMPGTGPVNADWIRRKSNTSELFQSSSYAVGLRFQREGTTLEAKQGLPLRDYTPNGGCVPIRVKGVGMVGSATVSGIFHRDDHGMVVRALAELAGVPLEQVALVPL